MIERNGSNFWIQHPKKHKVTKIFYAAGKKFVTDLCNL